jgi:hypothetical protein
VKACDRCLAANAFKTSILFGKHDGSRKSGARRILSVNCELCDQCITDLLHEFGRLKAAFLKAGISPDGPAKNMKEPISPATMETAS